MLTRRRTAGFTLIELLVVISIISVLAALSAGAFFRVRAAQQEKLTGEKIIQLQKVLQQQITAVLDTARKEPIPPIVLQYAQYDPDRAKAIWAYLHLRVNFPETVAEAQSGVFLGSPATLVLPRNEKIWSMVSGAGTLTPDEQAAACAYAFLTTVNRRGMESGINDAMTGKVGNYVCFTDTFNKPITFRRLFYTSEMDAKPYTATTFVGKRDPLDPLGKLQTLFVGPTALTAAQQADLLQAIGGKRMLNGSNFMPTFISSGLNRVFNPALPTTPALALTYNPNGDDLFGYRLNVEGLTGN